MVSNWDGKLEAIDIDDSADEIYGEDDDSSIEEYEKCDCVDVGRVKADKIPYATIYYDADEKDPTYFIPADPVTAQIIKVEKDNELTRHIFNPLLYTIELSHGPYIWTIIRRYDGIRKLDNGLMRFRWAEEIKDPFRKIGRALDDDDDERKMKGGGGHGVALLPAKSEDVARTGTSNGEESENRRPVSNRDADSKPRPHNPFGCRSRNHGKRGHICHLPHLPRTPERVFLSDPAAVEKRRKILEDYLNAVLHVPAYKNHKYTALFTEVSRLSFVNNVGLKSKEGIIQKCPGGRRTYQGWKRWIIAHCAPWSKRWLLVKDSFVAYLHPSDEEIRHVMLFDKDFAVKLAIETPKENNVAGKYGLVITNLSRNLQLRTDSMEKANQWRDAVLHMAETRGKIWLEPHRFNSFAPVRQDVYSQWFADASSMFDHAANMLELATEEIFITDWWLSPELFLKRPMIEGERWLLDKVLQRKAKQGIKIFVLLYKEVEVALGINSAHSKAVLEEMHENIKVIRHPDHGLGDVLFWAHHEKVIVIDQNIAFVGGIDLCFGRWDDHQHRLTDLGSVHFDKHGKKARAIDERPDPFADHGDSETEKQDAPKSHTPASVETQPSHESTDIDIEEPVERNEYRATSSRMASVVRQVTEDNQQVMAFSSAQQQPTDTNIADIVKKYREYVESGKAEENKARSNTPPLKRKSKKNKAKKAVSIWKRKLEDRDDAVDHGKAYRDEWKELGKEISTIGGLDLAGEGKFWIGKDYVNFIYKDFVQLDEPFSDFINRASTPRMPWHDIGSVVYGAAARDAARHFVQRWNHAKIAKLKDDEDYPLLIPKSYERVKVPRVFKDMSIKTNVQLLRSSGPWSAGITEVEDSIQNAYVDLISKAEHFIYIENQFFVSQMDSTDVTNRICQALYDRIVKAYQNGETFRVYVLIPLLPAFEGQIGTGQGSALQVVLHWAFVSICKGDKSLLYRLSSVVDDPLKYVSFCSLRTFDELSGNLVTELVYIHAKLMIVDDRKCIIGSANINDRSQLGKRDSEVCVCIEDVEFEDSTFNGMPAKSGKFCGSLRKRLMREHLGLLMNPNDEIQLDDIVCDDFYFNTWLRTATRNTDTFEQVFRCIPTDQVLSFDELDTHQKQSPLASLHPTRANKLLEKIKGFLVTFPTRFLFNSDLRPAVSTKEGLAPVAIFV